MKIKIEFGTEEYYDYIDKLALKIGDEVEFDNKNNFEFSDRVNEVGADLSASMRRQIF